MSKPVRGDPRIDEIIMNFIAHSDFIFDGLRHEKTLNNLSLQNLEALERIGGLFKNLEPRLKRYKIIRKKQAVGGQIGSQIKQRLRREL